MADNQEILHRLRRVEGQIQGLQKMIAAEASCADILMQVAAARSAINKVGTLIFESHFRECLEKALEEENMDEFIRSLTRLMDRYVK
jgi:CsoR family transcriptional regulator, copper-sensing transcriptional repressor